MTEEWTVRHLGRAKQELESKSLGTEVSASGTLHLFPGFPYEMLIFLIQERKK